MSTRPTRLLLLDDEEYITHIMCYKLQQAGLDPVSGSDGREGLALAAQHQPDLVICDYQMPEMDGLEFAKALAADPATAHIPVILLTARGHRISPESLANTSVRYLMAKPFSIRDVLDRISEILPEAPINLAAAAQS